MHDRAVWHLEKLPEGKNPFGCRWVYTIRNENGEIACFKARLVAQGFKQVKGESYEETFSPVVNFGIIRLSFSLLVSYLGWTHLQMDIVGAYLYAPLKKVIYMKQPQGCKEQGKDNLHCRLDRALHGLHQSGRLWFYEFHEVLTRLHFKKLDWCNCTYVFNSDLVLALYVDIVCFGRNRIVIDKVVKLLKGQFDLKVLGKT
ncbi:retrovirus-related Pol polyprotein from transposon TNT 1-94 [Trichonephila clavipes]|nr:retrovirus-related Pol polyprotein from transposon TNT 1-94 [Trichonephila clavipes]